MKNSLSVAVISLGTAFLFTACATEVSPPPTSLYERLGGKEAIQMVVSDFVDTVGEDPRIQNKMVADRLAAIDINGLKSHLVDQICMATGGPCTYKGRSMKEAHTNLGITTAEFNYVVEDLVKTLDKYQVPQKEQQELLALLGPMKPDIVEVP